jgi:N-acetylneuraminic acid mutarotase
MFTYSAWVRRILNLSPKANRQSPRQSRYFRPMVDNLEPRNLLAVTPWSFAAPMPNFLESMKATTGLDGRVYVIGGYNFDTNSDTNAVSVYNPDTNTWAAAANLPAPIAIDSNGVTTGTDGKIYVFGGFVATGLDSQGNQIGHGTNKVYIYTPTTNTWATAANNMPASLYSTTAATGVNGRIYVIGGFDDALNNATSAEYIYTPSTDSWVIGASMPAAKANLAVATGPDGRIYAIGGYGVAGNTINSSTVFAYTPSTNTWSAAIASLPTARQVPGAAAGPDGRIFVFGGSDTTLGDTNTMFAYTPSTNSWAADTSMNTARVLLASALGKDGRIYAIGGFDPALSAGLGNDTNTVEVLGLPFYDNFNRPDSGNLGVNWVTPVGTDVIQGNLAKGRGSLNLSAVKGLSVSDVLVQATVTLPVNSQVGLIARYSGPGDTNMYWGMLFNTGGTTYAMIWRNSGGTWTFLDSEAIPGNPMGGLLRFTVIGNSLKLFLNGALVASAVDATPLAPGSVGLRSLASTTFENFSARAAVFDAFTQPNGTPLNPARWTQRAGTFTVTNNMLGGGFGVASWNGLNEADVRVEAEVTLANTDSQVGLIARYSGPGDTNMYWGMLANVSGTVYAEIWRNTNGAWALLSFMAVPGNPKNGHLAFEVVGNSLKLFLNGTQFLSVVDATPLGAGSVGVRASVNTTIDNFQEAPIG